MVTIWRILEASACFISFWIRTLGLASTSLSSVYNSHSCPHLFSSASLSTRRRRLPRLADSVVFRLVSSVAGLPSFPVPSSSSLWGLPVRGRPVLRVSPWVRVSEVLLFHAGLRAGLRGCRIFYLYICRFHPRGWFPLLLHRFVESDTALTSCCRAPVSQRTARLLLWKVPGGVFYIGELDKRNERKSDPQIVPPEPPPSSTLSTNTDSER